MARPTGNYDRGNGRGRARGHGRGHGQSRNDRGNRHPATGICRDFVNGGCNRQNCRFSHDLNDNQQQPQGRAEASPKQEAAKSQYNTWKRLLGGRTLYCDPGTMKQVWEGAVAILESGDRDQVQQLPRDLDKDEDRCQGRQHVKALLNRRAHSTDTLAFIQVSSDFLKVITHDSLLDCLAVDEYVTGIYNFIDGGNGARAFGFFQHLCERMVTTRVDGISSVPQPLLEQSIIRLSTALYELLHRKRRARLYDDLDELIETMTSASEILPAVHPSVTTTSVKRRLNDVRALIDRARGLIADEPQAEEARRTAPATTYPREIIIPANRHENDKLDICDVSLFPTRDELMSDAKEFLPFTDPDQPHFLTNKVERHIDTQFRLYRHDCFGELKNALSSLLHAATNDSASLSRPQIHLGDMRVYNYQGAYVSYVTFETRHGLQAQISFPQPMEVRRHSSSQRATWWQESRRLEEGSLLSFVFIHEQSVQHLFFTVTKKNMKSEEEFNLAKNISTATITVKLATQSHATLQSLVDASCRKVRGLLLEFPNVLPATFLPILENLQDMQRSSRLRFAEWILPDVHDEQYQDIPPPLYARSANFMFPLAAILTEAAKAIDETYCIPSMASASDVALIEEVVAKTTLDVGQSKALVAALTREFALIQGPPGTGKSFVGLQVVKVLLAIKKRVSLGPIIVVCFTNHALDQFLEHLIGVGITNIIRVGGQCKSEKLASHNLREISRSESKTGTERFQAHNMYAKLEEHEETIGATVRRLHINSKNADWRGLGRHLFQHYPQVHAQFDKIDDGGWKTAGRHPFDVWRSTKSTSSNTGTAATDVSLLIRRASSDVLALNTEERKILVNHWLGEIRADALADLSETVDDANKCQQTLNKIHDEADRRILSAADIIGVTTSGLAKRVSVLKHVNAKVVICEEAGEVMEPHMLAALLPTVEHCIQIGDHEQLRPTINNFQDLSLESHHGALHALDKSQFERLSIGERGRPSVPVAQLEVQRRMRPDVSTLIRETIYPKLIDHDSTLNLPDVVGMRNNVYWLDHKHLEDQKAGTAHHNKSRSNEWEMRMVHALVRHIVRQGVYKSDEIAVLTPYTGQLQKLRAALRNDFEIVLSERDQEALDKDGFEEGDAVSQESLHSASQRRKPLATKQLGELLRIATVDNFQGEEAKIIIVSLVRSNTEKKVGFLKTTNRINVLLSRAQHGMYLIGNVDTYSSVGMWQKVIGMLRAKDLVGTNLALCCPRHVEKVIEIHEPDDFATDSPEGGCRKACRDRLDCGHSCQARCHSEAMHAVWKCEMPCQRRHIPCDHPCQKATCGEECGSCKVQINNVPLRCGHTKDNVLCHQATHELDKIQCRVLVKKQVPSCKHTIQVQCSVNVDREDYLCPFPCGTILPCGHKCPGSCGRCKKQDLDGTSIAQHLECTKTCGRKHGTCNHNCEKKCHGGSDCGPCQQSCEVRCKHSHCKAKCFESCAPCIEPCLWSCEHQGSCSMPCSAPCDRLPCDLRCTKLLPCGHQCPGLCGEECPADICQQCGMRAEEQPDLVMMSSYKDIDLDDNPIVVLGCQGRHFFTVETLDGVIGMRDVYKVDSSSGAYIGLQENDQLAPSVPQCPTCREPIRQYATQRYNRLVNGAVIDEMSKRFVVSGQQKIQELAIQMQSIEQSLEDTRANLVASPSSRIGKLISDRYRKASQLEWNAKHFLVEMDEHHKPAYRLYEATVYARGKQDNLVDGMANMTLGSTCQNKQPASQNQRSGQDQRITLGGRLNHIKVLQMILNDKFEIMRTINSVKFPGGSPIDQSEQFLNKCQELITTSKDAHSPKVAVEAALQYAHIARLFNTTTSTAKSTAKAMQYRETARALLTDAQTMCEKNFQNRDQLQSAIELSLRSLGREFYTEVTKEEIMAIKQAMVSGRGGIATHTGHWYKCENGHPFAIGECGMPMEQACCPECGAAVGGQNHRAVNGVTRATEMESI